MQRGRLIVERNACIVQRERRDKLCGGIVHLAQEQELSGHDALALDSDDAPILAALASHRRALEDAEARTADLEREKAAWGRASGALRHQAEVVEVALTDQLRQLTEMRDDCTTSQGRASVKTVVDWLQALGARLLRVSGAS